MLETGQKKKKTTKVFVSWLVFIQGILSIAFCGMALWLDVLTAKYIAILAAVLVVPIVVESIAKRWKAGRLLGGILAVFMIAWLCVGSYYIYETRSTIGSITSTKTEKFGVNVYVLKKDPAQKIEDAKDYTFGILESLDRENTDATIDKINKELGKDIKVKEYSGLFELMDAFMDGKVKAIITNQGCINIAAESEGYEKTADKIREIYTNEINKEVAVTNTKSDSKITKESFVVYVSGIDTRGSEIVDTRSDVNILMVVNPVDKKILLLSTPRDYYVPLSISNGVKDKLTHAGIYGIDVSMDTLGMLYGIDVDQYVRVNFAGFVKIIDALGGIEVDSDYSFTSNDGYKYTKGINKLDGELALSFARERYAFTEGDRQRGKDQMKVITAVIDKVTSPAVLKNYASLMDSIKGCLQTSLSSSEIGDLVQMQLNDKASWEVTSYSVDGTGASKKTYTIPKARAYVMVPDEETVAEAKARITETMGQ